MGASLYPPAALLERHLHPNLFMNTVSINQVQIDVCRRVSCVKAVRERFHAHYSTPLGKLVRCMAYNILHLHAIIFCEVLRICHPLYILFGVTINKIGIVTLSSLSHRLIRECILLLVGATG